MILKSYIYDNPLSIEAMNFLDATFDATIVEYNMISHDTKADHKEGLGINSPMETAISFYKKDIREVIQEKGLESHIENAEVATLLDIKAQEAVLLEKLLDAADSEIDDIVGEYFQGQKAKIDELANQLTQEAEIPINLLSDLAISQGEQHMRSDFGKSGELSSIRKRSEEEVSTSESNINRREKSKTI